MSGRLLPMFWRVALVALIALAGCARTPPTPRYQPYESVMEILAEIAGHRDDDLYRFGYPRDIAGQNLFRATLKRIENYQTQYPAAFLDVLAVSRGQLLERLGDYPAAQGAYQNLGHDPAPELKAAAEQSLGFLNQLMEIAGRAEDRSSLDRYLGDLESKRDALLALAGRFEGKQPYRSLALMEAENADLRRCVYLFNNRYVLPGGLQAALTSLAGLIERNADSRLIYSHILLMGDFHFAQAKDYVAVHDPSQLDFDDEEFDAYVSAAREFYFQVSQIDGAAEKLEGRAKLDAALEFARRIHDLRQ